jgi:hypothetical protein
MKMNKTISGLIVILAVSLIPQGDALMGDIQETWHIWDVSEDQTIHVSLIDNRYATSERIAIINQTIMSNETLEIDDSLMHKGPKSQVSTYYLGWHGALNSITDTKFPVPKNLEFNLTDRATGDIIILLSNFSHPEFSGFTQKHNETVIIEIFKVQQLSSSQLNTIVRHELGHAFGLSHSTAPEDLMAPETITNFPYISPCNIMALQSLYDGQSKVTCKK